MDQLYQTAKPSFTAAASSSWAAKSITTPTRASKSFTPATRAAAGTRRRLESVIVRCGAFRGGSYTHRRTPATAAHRLTGTLAYRHTGTSAQRHTGALAHQHSGTPAHWLTSTPAHRHTGTPPHTGSPAHRHTGAWPGQPGPALLRPPGLRLRLPRGLPVRSGGHGKGHRPGAHQQGRGVWSSAPPPHWSLVRHGILILFRRFHLPLPASISPASGEPRLTINYEVLETHFFNGKRTTWIT